MLKRPFLIKKKKKKKPRVCVLVGFVVQRQNKGEEERKISREWSLSAKLWGGAVAQGHLSSVVPLQSSVAS